MASMRQNAECRISDRQSKESRPTDTALGNDNISRKKSYVNPVSANVDGQSVTINGIDRIEKDGNRAQMYVKTQDGGSVALSDVRFDSRETEALYNVAQGFDSTDTARAFISGYKQGDSASEYMNAFLDFRRAGQLGQDFESVLQSNANKYAGLEESQLRQAYYAGVNEKNNAPKHYSAKEEKRAEKNGGLLRNYTKKLNAEQAGSVYVLEALAKKYGFVVEVCDTLADGMANGEYDPKTGRIKIALDAEENAYLRTAGHELYHYIEDWNSTAAGELREYVIGKLKESENYDYEGRVKELQKLYEGFGKADIEAEIVAESMFDVFDEKTIRELVNENRPLAVKIQSWIRGFLESIEKALTALGLKSPEVRALEGDTEALEKISGMFKSALEGAKENKSEKHEDGRYSLKSEDTLQKRNYTYNEIVSKNNMQIIDLSREIPRRTDGKVDKKSLVETAMKNAEKVGGQNAQGNAIIHVDDTERDVVLSKASLRHGIDRRIERQAPVILQIGEVLKNSIEINELTPKKQLAENSYVLLGVAQKNGERHIISSIVNSFTNEIEQVDVLYSINVKKESAVSKTRASGNALQSLTDSTISISDLLEIVKDVHPEILPKDVLDKFNLNRGNSEIESKLKYSLKSDSQTKSKAFKDWFGDWENNPESASKIVNEDGTPRIIYHQTAAEFNVFSNANPLAGRNDSETPNGFFAKDNDADIGVGGNKQMALYGDMKKPLHFKDRAEARYLLGRLL